MNINTFFLVKSLLKWLKNIEGKRKILYKNYFTT